jgi:hypothetical protein
MPEEERRARFVRREQFASAASKQFREAVVATHFGRHSCISSVMLGALDGAFEPRMLSGALRQPPNHLHTGRGWGAMPPPHGLRPPVTPQLDADAEDRGAQGAMPGDSQLP